MESGNAEQQLAPVAGEATTAAAAATTTKLSQQKVQQRVKQLRTEAEAETEKGSEESLRKALTLYAEALALVLPPPPAEDEDDQELPPPTPAAAPLFGGRSTVLIKMEQPEAALLDACYAVSHDPRWAKGYYHHGSALLAVGRAWDARNSFAQALALSPKTQLFVEGLAQAEAAYTKSYHDSVKSIFLKDGSVEVRHINAERGKGVFAEMDYTPGQSVFIESPLVSHKIVAKPEAEEGGEEKELPQEDIEGCAYCLRCSLPKDRFPLSDAIHKAIYTEGVPEGVDCEHCEDEHYCSEECRKVAWAHFHKSLCVGQDPSADHPMLKLEALASECERTNPLMIARIFAMIVQRVQATNEDPRMAFAPFANFVSNEEKFPHDTQALSYIEQQLFKDMSQADKMRFAQVVNIEHFRLLNGAIMRNAQTVCPVTDLHSFLAEAADEDKPALLEAINRHLFEDEEDGDESDKDAAADGDKGKEKEKEKDTAVAAPAGGPKGGKKGEDFRFENIYEFLDCPIMRNLTVGAASGLFVFANSMNHSCAPNVIVVSCFNSFLIRVIAINEIKKGDELCFSYIDEEAPFEQRQRQLEKLYLFECRCEKCAIEARIHAHIKRGPGGNNNKKPGNTAAAKKKSNAKGKKGGRR